MIFNASPSDEWKKDEKRENVLVFIGRKMKDLEPAIRKGFEACLVNPPKKSS